MLSVVFFRPDLQHNVLEKQSQHKSHKSAHDKSAKQRNFAEGENVFVKMHRRDDWKPGNIVKRVAPPSFRIDIGNGRIRQCHVNQIL